MSPNVKSQLLKSAEKLTESALNEVVSIAEVFAADSANPIDDTVVNAVKLLKQTFLDSLVNKIDEDDAN
jgi:hypothetical protein